MKLEINEQLYLQLLEPEHSSELYTLMCKNAEYYITWFPWIANMQSEEFISNYIKDSKQRTAEGTEYAFALFLGTKMIGRLGIYRINLINKIGEIGYWIDQDYEGKGYIKKACERVLQFAFNDLHLNRMELKCASDNIRSKHTAQRLHFTYEGTLRQAEQHQRGALDLLLFSLLKEEWEVGLLKK
ncbi:MAG: GNAT family N-acetyltransferase [Bacteroidetes bacterium]|nr:GNAT family N-acetyltransferase [Bacteroidota bacterium]MBK9672631.1 GNAT family N-acetyltransferase [Bacteroidota bacterium]MBK9800344.1 GNAT family N-acetyltransferase [Bacteroidota bacterium]MBP6412313.1 GNAT family N-acetyltransferase [Bacteroidia bacterium]